YFELSTAFPVTKLRGKRDRTLKTFFLAVLPMMQRFARQLCTTSVPRLTFGSGPAVLAKVRLPACYYRGMRRMLLAVRGPI
ncbi:hypothetical protein FOZ62_018552, partial [Perkinsus olseni]